MTDESLTEQRLASVLSDATDAICRGELIDIELLCRENPDIADELRRLLGAVLVTDTAGAAADEGLADPSHLSPRWRSLKLPTTVGDYELTQELGRGGMGVVFRARQISLNREVAVKMILRGRLASETDLERFLAEASATAKLKHPNIVPVYDVGDVDGRPFFSMQLVEGQTLSNAVSMGPLPPRRAAEIVAAIARAMAFAHREGILHRDLKPSNIMISSDGTPLITDFGLAKQASSEDNLTRSGMLLGTPAYMSPEQAGGRRALVGPLSDVYSLGCVLYFALTGRSPFVADSPMEVVMLVIEQDPTPPRALRPSLDRDLEMIVIRCLQKPMDLRYDSAEALAKDLEAYLADEKVSARSGQFNQVIARLFRETHHASVLENWGLLWMWHSLVVLVASLLTWQMEYSGVTQRWIYAAVWTLGLGAWAAVFWKLRQRMGPVTFIERQIAHVWGASLIAIALLFPLEWWLGMKVLSLSPMLGVISATVFIVKAGMLTGAFYIQATALLAASFAMAIWPQFAHLIFGMVAAICFFQPGYKYARQSKRAR
ncbi:Serine/threonine-protein kinase PknB [Rubripirellula amarantea]|uniref:non-specific serine/threonine protein kinase n=1 Tax=Rubripirellula amarantea TaxID=2527999 RepID=A0A5C5WWP3_9BACT|nr:serine/threonine-protein kinase [Rubripirellula amarantea]TWT54403.1 Serine/threonine-protein kinase PknB [Rubripirellula amarantea]